MAEYCMKCMMPVNGEETCPHCGHKAEYLTVPHRLAPGTILIDRYLIGTAIGQGGFGITYMARDLRLNMRVAVKEYYPNGYTNRNTAVSSELTISDQNTADFIEEGKKKFLSEARALARFHEERGVVEVRDFFEANKTAYIVMEYLDGQDLRKHLKQSLFTADQVFALMGPVMDALEKIHEVGIIHRDISPDNIMLLKNGSVKLMDFGAARLLDLSDQKSVSVVLKAGYAPEEQYRPKGKQGPWTDIYALCATMYKCITGITPDDALERTHEDELKWPSELGIEITVLQEDVLKKGMAVYSEDRFRNVGEMKTMLAKASVIHAVELEADDDVTVYVPRKKVQEEEKDSGTDIDPKEEPEEKSEEKPVEAEEMPPAKKKMSPAVIGGLVVAVAVVGGLALFGGGKENSAGTDQAVEIEQMQQTQEAAVGSEAEVLQQSEDMRRILLTASEDMSVKDFNEAVEILKGRLDVFCNGREYELEVEEDRVDLMLPKAAFGTWELADMMQCYLSRPVEYYGFRRGAGMFASAEYFSIDRENFASVSMEFGTVEGFDVTLMDTAVEEYPYIKLVFTDEFAEKHKAEIEAWGSDLVIAQDIEMSPIWYHDLYAEGDGKTFYIVSKETSAAFIEMAYHNLTHDPLAEGFYFSSDLNYEADWEDVAMAADAGKMQKNPEEILGKTVTMQYNFSEVPTDGELLDMKAGMKQRLDALGQEYALGTLAPSEEEFMFTVKIGMSRVGLPITDLLGANKGRYAILGNLETASVEQLRYEKQEDGTYAAYVSVASHYVDELERMIQDMKDAGKERAFLTVSGCEWLAADVENYLGDGTFKFDQLCFWNYEPITEEYLWLLQVMDTVFREADLPMTFSSIKYQLNEDENGKMAADTDFYVSYNDLSKEIADNISDIYENATVNSNNETVYVSLHMNTGKNFAKESLDLVHEIYESCGFDESGFSGLTFYLLDEDNLISERARIWFQKVNGYGAENKGYIYSGGVFANGRIDEYREDFQNVLETDPFYKKFAEYEYTSYLYEY